MPKSVADRTIGRILLVSLDNLGDLVFSSALVPPLQARFPAAGIDLWCKAYTADIGRLIPGVVSVIAADPFWDRAPGHEKGRALPFLRAIARVRGSRYDVAILCAAPWRTAAAVAATGIPVRIGLRRRKNSAFLSHVLPSEDVRRPVLAELSRLLTPLGIAPEPLRYRLDPGPLAARVLGMRERLRPPFVAIHPFASKRDRCLPLTTWLVVARDLTDRGLQPVWLGSGDELAELRSVGIPASSACIDAVGDGSLADTAAALSLASLFLGHDSGPLHVAGALGVPVVGVFAPGEPLRTFPQGVGPWRIVARPSASDVGASDVLREADALLPAQRAEHAVERGDHRLDA